MRSGAPETRDSGFEVRAVREYGWASKLNGELLRAADAEFDVFVTLDRGLVHQQSFSGLQLAVIVLIAYSNNIDSLRPLLPELVPLVASISPGEVVHLGPPR